MKYFQAILLGCTGILVLMSCQTKNEKKASPPIALHDTLSVDSIMEKGQEVAAPVKTEKENALIAATQKYPDSSLLWEDLIQYYRENGNYSSARNLADAKSNKQPGNPRWYFIKGTLAYEDEDTAMAIKSFENAIAISPNPDYFMYLATLYAETKNQKALKIADEFLAGSKKHEDKNAFFIKGLFYSRTGQYQKAIFFFNKALTMSYTFMEAYREKALALYHLEKYEDALEVLNKALTIMNSWDEGYYYSGMVLEKMNKRDEAITSYKNALTLSPDYKEAQDALNRLGVH